MKGTFSNAYKKIGEGKNNFGKLINVYTYQVSGTEAELKRFKEVMGDNYQVDTTTKAPLWWSTRPLGEQVELFITRAKDGKPSRVAADTSEVDSALDLANQHDGTAVGNALAQRVADMLFQAQVVNKRAPKESVEKEQAPEAIDGKKAGK